VYHKDDGTGYSQIYKVSSTGGAEIALTNDTYWREYPQWSPDGNWVVYDRGDATGYYQIYKVPSGVGIEESKRETRQETRGIRIYPNPFITSTSIYLSSIGQSAKSIELRIYDLGGRLVKLVPLTTDHYSLTVDFSPGIYFLNVQDYKPIKVIKLR